MMTKPLMALVAAAMLSGCVGPGLAGIAGVLAGLPGVGTPASPGASAAPPTPAAPGTPSTTSLSDAQLDAYIACGNTKGATGVALAQAWAAVKKNIPDGTTRAAVTPTIQLQAKAIGCQ